MADEQQLAITAFLGAILFFLALYLFLIRKKEENEEKSAEQSVSEVKKTKETSTNAKKTKGVGHKKKTAAVTAKDLGINHSHLIASIKGHTAPILSLDFSTNGKMLASCSEDRTIRLWYVKDFREKDHKYSRVNVEFDHATDVSFSPDSRAFIASLGNDKKLRVFKINKEKKDGSNTSITTISSEFDFEKVHKSDIISVGISSSGKFIMSADKETEIIIWTIKGEVLDKIDTLLMFNKQASISPCGNLIAACGFTSEVKLWYVHFSKTGDFQQVTKTLEIKGHKAGVLSFSFTNDCKRLATVSKDGTWKVWDINVNYLKGQEAYLLNTGNISSYEDGMNVNIALSHDYFTVAVSIGSNLSYYNTKTQELEDHIESAHPGIITTLKWYSDSKLLLSAGGTDRMIRVWENLVGAKANMVDLQQKLPKATSNSVRERIEQQIADYKMFINKFQKE